MAVTEVQEPTAEETRIVTVFISKAKAGIDVDLPQLPPEVWSEVVYEGLQKFLTKGTSKITTKLISRTAPKINPLDIPPRYTSSEKFNSCVSSDKPADCSFSTTALLKCASLLGSSTG